jgi:hypothetical protein
MISDSRIYRVIVTSPQSKDIQSYWYILRFLLSYFSKLMPDADKKAS